MATASGGFSFGNSTGLFGSSTKTSASTLPTFGTSTSVAPAGLSFGLAKTVSAPTTSTGLPSFGTSSAFGISTTTSGLNFGKPAASVSAFTVSTTSQAKTQPGFGALSSTGTTSTGFGFGQNLLGGGTKTSTGFGTQLTTSANQNANAFSFGGATASVAASVPTSNVQQSLENPKEAQLPQPLLNIYQELSKHIKDQRAKKDEIARFSAQLINRATEEITALKQLVSDGSNGVQRDAIAVENLKCQVSQELKFAEIACRVHDTPLSMQHDYSGPIEYFQYLAQSFETRLITYRKQLDELEAYLSSASPVNQFTPQELFHVLARLNDTFLALASQLHLIHESVKELKDKYSQYRRIVLNDQTDIFGFKPRATQRIGARGIGPCPFSGMAGTTNHEVAANTNISTSSSMPTANTNMFGLGSANLGQQSLMKSSSGISSGMIRSLSFSGLSSRPGTASTSLGSSLTSSMFGKTGFTSTTPQFQLQNPPGTKRGKEGNVHTCTQKKKFESEAASLITCWKSVPCIIREC
eukprot:gene7298-8114_t